MSVSTLLSDEEAIQTLSGSELAIGEAALSAGPIDLNLAYLHQHPRIATIASLPDLGRNLAALTSDVRSLVVRRLGGHVHASMQQDAR